MSFLLKALIIITTVISSGCYSNWQNLDAFVAKISCNSTEKQISKVTKLNFISHEWDAQHHILSVYKNSDAIAVSFNQKGKLLSISASKSQIKLFGLFRKQATAVTILNCEK